MKTIEEKAEAICTFKKFGEGLSDRYVIIHNTLIQGRREGYIKGATEQKAIDIDKACDWLKENYWDYINVANTDYGKPYDLSIDIEEIITDFRKAMEE